MDREIESTRDYFSKRASRYALALSTFPFSRILDLVPYLYEIPDVANRFETSIDNLNALDAFGGTGFFTHAFRHSNIQFSVGDCCPQMLSLGDHQLSRIRWIETLDYFSSWAKREPASMDFILCHGGLHHVVRHLSGEIDHSASRELQEHTIANLAKLLRPGGSLIIGDVPANTPESIFSGNAPCRPSQEDVETLIGRDQMKKLGDLSVFTDKESLRDLAHQIRSKFSLETGFGVPRYFFDEFVAKDTPLGHEASFVPIKELDEMADIAGLENTWKLDFLGPWIFPSPEDAGWYFREKFAVGQSSLPGEEMKSQMKMLEAVKENLGTRDLSHLGFAVNWGVVYSCFRKPC